MEELIQACVELLAEIGNPFGGSNDEKDGADKGYLEGPQPVDPFRDIRYEERS